MKPMGPTKDYPVQPSREKCPAFLEINGEKCERLFNDGAHYRLVAWPFTFRVTCRMMGWLWSVEGMGAEKKAMVAHTGDPESDANQAAREAMIAAGDLVRKLFSFAEYKDYDDR